MTILLKTREQIAAEFGVSRKTLYRWLKQKGISLPKGLICPETQKDISQKLFGEMSQNVP